MPVDPIDEFPSDSSCSLGAVRPAGHHSDSSQGRFVGRAWCFGDVAYPSSSAPQAEHLDPRGYEDYVYDELYDDEADPPSDAVACGSGGGSLVLPSDDWGALFYSSTSLGGSE